MPQLLRTLTTVAILGTAMMTITIAQMSMGPADRPAVDSAAADRGKKTYAAECIGCHGTQARGTEKGGNLIRSVLVLRDRYGSELGPFFKKGHTMQSGKSTAELTEAQVKDLANFIRQRVDDTLRGSPIFQPQNILTGDAKAGAAYFQGEGKCATCHSATGNLAGYGGKFAPVDIQQRFLFPPTRGGGRGRGAAPATTPSATAVKVTVTPSSGPAISGVLVQMDDFLVTLRDSDGNVRTIRRVPGMTVVKDNPLQYHIDLLPRIGDKNMHDVVAYLETLK
jgi:cytochrome c oxidase cbb3-type subunit 3